MTKCVTPDASTPPPSTSNQSITSDDQESETKESGVLESSLEVPELSAHAEAVSRLGISSYNCQAVTHNYCVILN